MDPFEVQKLESLVNLFYSPPDEKSRKLAECKLSSFFDNPENFSSILYLSLSNYSCQLQYLSLSPLISHLSSKWKSLSSSYQSSLFQEFFNSIFHSSKDSPSYIISGKCKILATLCRLGWNEIIQSQVLLKEVRTIACNDRSLLLPSIYFFNELINEMTQPIKYRALPIKKKNLVNFKENMLEGIFLFSVELLQNYLSLQEAELEKLLDLVNAVLCVEFTINVDDEDIGAVPSMWKALYEEILKFVDKFMFSGFGSSEVIETKTVVLIGSLGKVKKIMLSAQVPDFVSSYLKVTINICLYKSFSGDKLTEYIKGLKTFSETFELACISQSQYFNEWIQSLKSMSLRLFTLPEAIVSQYNSSMTIWNYISSESNTIPSQNISLLISSLFKPFISSTLACVNAELILENLDQIKDHLDLISNFSLYFSAEFLTILIEIFTFVLETWSKDRSSASESQLSWLILLASSFLTYKSTKSSIDQNNFILQQILYIIQTANSSEVCLSISCVNYLTIYSKLWVNVAEDNHFDLTEDNDSSESSLKVLDKIVVFIFKEMQFNSHPLVVNWVLDLFEFLAKGHFSAKVLQQVTMIQDFSYNYLNYPLCLHDSKLRSKVFHVLASLWMHEQNTEGLDSLLAPYEQAIRNDGQRQPEYFEFLFREIQGICSAITSRSEFFTWFIDRAEFFVGVSNEFFMENRTFTAFLKMLQEVTDVRGNRIVFNENSAYGVIMFKKIAPVITSYSHFISSRSSEIENFLGKSKRIVGIMKNFLLGGYVCFGVFQVFNDPTFANSINSTFTVISNLIYEEILIYSKLLDNIFEYFEALCKNHSNLLLSISNPDYVNLVLMFVKNGIKSSSNRNLDIKYCHSAAKTLTYICEEIVKVLIRSGDSSQLISDIENSLKDLTEVVLETILMEESNFLWSLKVPLMGLAIINHTVFPTLCQKVVGKVSASSEHKSQIENYLENLMLGVERNMKESNIAVFSKNFSLLKNLIGSRY